MTQTSRNDIQVHQVVLFPFIRCISAHLFLFPSTPTYRFTTLLFISLIDVFSLLVTLFSRGLDYFLSLSYPCSIPLHPIHRYFSFSPRFWHSLGLVSHVSPSIRPSIHPSIHSSHFLRLVSSAFPFHFYLPCPSSPLAGVKFRHSFPACMLYVSCCKISVECLNIVVHDPVDLRRFPNRRDF